MRKLTKMSAMLLASGLILTGCGGNKSFEEKKKNKQRCWLETDKVSSLGMYAGGKWISLRSGKILKSRVEYFAIL